MTFKDYLDSLPNMRVEQIRRIEEATCSSSVTIYRWLNGSVTPPPLKQRIISEITGIPVKELFPVKATCEDSAV
jgi:hypothetical protein